MFKKSYKTNRIFKAFIVYGEIKTASTSYIEIGLSRRLLGDMTEVFKIP